jgi:hypothetical protein
MGRDPRHCTDLSIQTKNKGDNHETDGTVASAADKNPCAEDIAKFCQDSGPGMMNRMDCLEKHENELSPACKEFETAIGGRKAEMRERVKEMAKFRQACMGDMAKFCNDANPMQAGMIKCLNDHEGELSPACGQMMKSMTMMQEFEGGF